MVFDPENSDGTRTGGVPRIGPASAMVAKSSEEGELESPDGLFNAAPAWCSRSAAPARVGESGSNPCLGSCMQLPWDGPLFSTNSAVSGRRSPRHGNRDSGMKYIPLMQ